MDHLIHLKHFLRWQKFTSGADMSAASTSDILQIRSLRSKQQCENSRVTTHGLL